MEIKETATTLSFFVQVVPKSSKNKIMGNHGGALKIKITAPPVEGKANAMCVKFLAKQLGVPRSMISITAGTTAKKKEITISINDDAPGRKLLGELKTRIKALAV
ncbi:MAG: DUF167 domain-containing protein [Thermodesulfobacteriota bacterium]|nr:DUF167 domain-containing protein [Thermodesulfobacteriota bacterium]